MFASILFKLIEVYSYKMNEAFSQFSVSGLYAKQNFDSKFGNVLLTLANYCELQKEFVRHAHIYSRRKKTGQVPALCKVRGQ